MKTTKKNTYVLLTWVDSFTYSEAWMDNDEINLDPYIITTAGMLVKENKKHISIALGTHGGRSMGVAEIPKGCIREIKRIKFPLKHNL